MTGTDLSARVLLADQSTHCAPRLAEHSVFLLYPFQLKETAWPLVPDVPLGSLAGAGWLAAVGETLRKTETRQLWLRKRWPINDLYRKAGQQLGLGIGDAQDEVWTLDSQKHVQRWLCGASGVEQILHVPLSTAAKARLARCGLPVADALPISFGCVRLVPFRTKLALLIVEVRLAPGQDMMAPMLVEGVAALCHGRELFWRLKNGTEVRTHAGKAGFPLAELLTSLLGDLPVEPLKGERLFSYTYAAFDGRIDDIQRQTLLVQLARKQTGDYRQTDFRHGLHEVRFFDTVAHAVSAEGCVSLVARVPAEGAAEPAEFLKTFRTNTLEARYLPIAAINLHAREALLRLSQDSGFWPEMAHPTDTNGIKH